MKKPIELSRKKSAYSVYVYGALDVRLFLNKRLNVDLKNIEIWVSHGLKVIFCTSAGNTDIPIQKRDGLEIVTSNDCDWLM